MFLQQKHQGKWTCDHLKDRFVTRFSYESEKQFAVFTINDHELALARSNKEIAEIILRKTASQLKSVEDIEKLTMRKLLE